MGGVPGTSVLPTSVPGSMLVPGERGGAQAPCPLLQGRLCHHTVAGSHHSRAGCSPHGLQGAEPEGGAWEAPGATGTLEDLEEHGQRPIPTPELEGQARHRMALQVQDLYRQEKAGVPRLGVPPSGVPHTHRSAGAIISTCPGPPPVTGILRGQELRLWSTPCPSHSPGTGEGAWGVIVDTDSTCSQD